MADLTLFDDLAPPTAEGCCVTCHSPIPPTPAYRKARRHCSYWCHLADTGPNYFTLTTITPWLAVNRPNYARST